MIRMTHLMKLAQENRYIIHFAGDKAPFFQMVGHLKLVGMAQRQMDAKVELAGC
ncbi:MAG TPA: hypothetical protein VGN34_28090 [Ktedonobacteraceae bacterium]